MADKVITTVLSPDNSGNFNLNNIKHEQITRIDIVDVDLIITDKSGNRYVLPNAGVDAMGQNPPKLILSDSTTSLSDLLSDIGVTHDVTPGNLVPTTLEVAKDTEKDKGKLDTKEEEELQKKVEKLEQEVVAQKKEFEEETKKQADKQHEQEARQEQSRSLTQNTEGSVEQLANQAKQIDENLHRKDYDYVPPSPYTPPPSPITAADGVPPPLSTTPAVSITIGNVVGTTIAGPNIYGGGGAAGSDGLALLGPRDAQQFSIATINGTNGNDIIYAGGPLVGNAAPATDRSNGAKEILLNVAGYFTSLQDVQISGVPAGVSFAGGTDLGGGVWSMPSSFALGNTAFSMIYSMDTWRGGSDTFDLAIRIAGEGAKGQFFDTTQNFRFRFMDVTDVSQVTNPLLIYDFKGQTKQIYVLPTMGTPSTISSGDGDDQIYGWRGFDTITVGNGNNTIYSYEGNDTVSTGTGNNTIDLGIGNNNLTSQGGNDIVTAGDGDNTINVGNGINSVTLGNGSSSVTSGTDNDTIIIGNGNSTVIAGDGTNSITLGNGTHIITSGTGNDTITVGSGSATISAGDGTNVINATNSIVAVTTGSGSDTINITGGSGTVSTGSGSDTITVTSGNFTISSGDNDDIISAGDGNNTIDTGNGINNVSLGNGNNNVTTGVGNDTITSGNGNNSIYGNLGTNSYTTGTGVNVLNYSLLAGVGVTVSLLTNTATAAGLSDTFSNFINLTGSNQNDNLTGNASNNIIDGGSGDDTIIGGGGNDTLYGGDGNDTITGNTGNDTIYAGNGDNTIYTGVSGTDIIYGGTGNNTFVSQHAGVTYNGTNGGTIGAGIFNTVNYTSDTAGMTINLLGGTGTGGLANGDVYVLTSVAGVNSINRILAGSGSDILTDSNGNDYIDGGNGNNNFTTYNGNDTFIGGANNDLFTSLGSGSKVFNGGAGNNTYDLGIASENIISNGSGWDMIRYNRSVAGVLVNFDSVSKSIINSLGATVTVAATSGAGYGVTAADLGTYSIGDTYSGLSVDQFNGSGFNDILWDRAAGSAEFIGNGGVDYFFGGSGNNLVYLSDNDRIDTGGGTSDTIYANSGNNSFLYLDGNADINANSIADYIDRGVGSLTIAAGSSPTGVALNYTGFALGNGAANLLVNAENLLGEGGNDLLVGNGLTNLLYGRGGNNTLYGLGGDDALYSAVGGINYLDGGTGTDTADFSNSWFSSGTTTAAYVFLSDGTFLNGVSDKNATIGAGNSAYQAMTAGGTLATIVNIENITGSAFDDILYGDSLAGGNTIQGGAGNDIIAGQGGADRLFGAAGNDTFYSSAANIATTTLFDGGANSDTLVASGLSLTAGSIVGSKFVSIETLNIKNSSGVNNYSMNANDIVGLADNGASSTVTLLLDTGDTLTPTVGAGSGALSYLLAFSNATQQTYYFYSDAAHATPDAINRVAILDVFKT